MQGDCYMIATSYMIATPYLVCCAAGATVAIGVVVHVPHSAFPDEAEPMEGYWIGMTVLTRRGGKGDVGIKILGEPVFTRPVAEVASWVVMD
jgi:hypothetical protein